MTEIMVNNDAQWYHKYGKLGTKHQPIVEVIEIYTRCPGLDDKNLRVALYKCPNCGAEVEIFSDEIRVKCPKCGENVYREKIPSCIEWCASARQCLGEERWKQLKSSD